MNTKEIIKSVPCLVGYTTIIMKELSNEYINLEQVAKSLTALREGGFIQTKTNIDFYKANPYEPIEIQVYKPIGMF